MAVRAIGFVVKRKLLDLEVEMVATKNDEVVQDRVHDTWIPRSTLAFWIRRSHGQLLAFDAFFLQRCPELRRELRVAAVDQVRLTMFTDLGLFEKLLGLFRHPPRIGIPSRLPAGDLSCLQLNEHQYVKIDDALSRDGSLRGNVARPTCRVIVLDSARSIPT